MDAERAADVEAESVQNARREAPSAKLLVVFAVRIAWAECYHAACTSTCGTAVAQASLPRLRSVLNTSWLIVSV